MNKCYIWAYVALKIKLPIREGLLGQADEVIDLQANHFMGLFESILWIGILWSPYPQEPIVDESSTTKVYKRVDTDL